MAFLERLAANHEFSSTVRRSAGSVVIVDRWLLWNPTGSNKEENRQKTAGGGKKMRKPLRLFRFLLCRVKLEYLLCFAPPLLGLESKWYDRFALSKKIASLVPLPSRGERERRRVSWAFPQVYFHPPSVHGGGICFITALPCGCADDSRGGAGA